MFGKVAIIGLGLMGGSLAKAAKKGGLFENVIGIGRNENNLKKGIDLGIIDSYTTQCAEGVDDAELVVVATPCGMIVETIKAVSPCVPDGCIITDVGSVKKEIVKGVEGYIPENVHFIGGHPIAGKETSGIEASDSLLFVGHKCILITVPTTNKDALERIKTMWQRVGCDVLCMDMTEHDKILAAVSHLPHIIAFSLMNAITDMNDSDKDILLYSAGGLRDFTRIAASHPVMWRDISLMNKSNILNSIAHFQFSLEEIRKAIENGNSKKLTIQFEKSRKARMALS